MLRCQALLNTRLRSSSVVQGSPTRAAGFELLAERLGLLAPGLARGGAACNGQPEGLQGMATANGHQRRAVHHNFCSAAALGWVWMGFVI